MNTAETLRAAAARVRQGWCQDEPVDEHGNVCAFGAIAFAITGDIERVQRFYYSQAFQFDEYARLLRLVTRTTHPAPEWNDADGQTAENVALGLEYAALVWEQEQAQADPARLTPIAEGEAVGSATDPS